MAELEYRGPRFTILGGVTDGTYWPVVRYADKDGGETGFPSHWFTSLDQYPQPHRWASDVLGLEWIDGPGAKFNDVRGAFSGLSYLVYDCAPEPLDKWTVSRRRKNCKMAVLDFCLAHNGETRSLRVAEKGVRTGHDFANLMSALMSDIIEGRVTPNIGNATCNAGGKLLKVVEMQYKYGTSGPGQKGKCLILTLESPALEPGAGD
mgnify:CR=1 FL=1